MSDEILRRAFSSRAMPSHPEEKALVSFYRGGLSETEEEAIREHLASCGVCVELARDARTFVEAMTDPPAAMPFPRAKRWLAVAALLAAAAIALIWIARSRPVAPMPEAPARTAAALKPSWRELRISAPAYTPAPEDELLYRSEGSPEGSDFAEAMAPYVRGDYGAAEATLARYGAKHPGDPRAAFYRGASLLLIGREEEAVPLLRAAAETGRAVEGARWYLALAQLKSGNQVAALRDLEAVVRAGGAYADEAERLAAEVRSGSSGPPR